MVAVELEVRAFAPRSVAPVVVVVGAATKARAMIAARYSLWVRGCDLAPGGRWRIGVVVERSVRF